MYLVKALVDAVGPLKFGEREVEFAAGTCRFVHDDVVNRYLGNPAAFQVLAGPDAEAGFVALQGEVAGEGAGAKSGATVSSTERSLVVQRTVLSFADTPITIADDAGVAQYGGAGKIYTFPEGLILVLGAVVEGDVTLGTTGTITETWAGGVALGTAAATTGSTLTGTEADIMAENDVAAATDKVAAIAAKSSDIAMLDGTGTAKDVYLNLLVDDEATHTAGTGKFTGSVVLNWVHLGAFS